MNQESYPELRRIAREHGVPKRYEDLYVQFVTEGECQNAVGEGSVFIRLFNHDETIQEAVRVGLARRIAEFQHALRALRDEEEPAETMHAVHAQTTSPQQQR